MTPSGLPTVTERCESGHGRGPRYGRLAAAAMFLLPVGCSVLGESGKGDLSRLTVNDILSRCGAAHREVQTLRARGRLRDSRQISPRTVPIAWDFFRPDRCRLQIDMDVAIVAGEDWWTYDGQAGEYRKHHQFTRAPIETAAYLASKGVPFLLPSLLNRGEYAFDGGRAGSAARWELQGVGWYAEAPCYVVIRRSYDHTDGEILRVWIDQDKLLLRGWMVSVPVGEGRERPLVECTYLELAANGPLPSDWLQLKPPMPIKVPTTAD